MTRRNWVLVAVVFASILVSLAVCPLAPPVHDGGERNIPFITINEIRDSSIATKYGIRGYIEITADRKILNLNKDNSITLFLHFVSHVPELTEAQVLIDPSREVVGVTLEIGDININKLVSYDPSGILTVKVDETLPVTLTLCIPDNVKVKIPRVNIPFQLSAVGIQSETEGVPLLDEVNVDVYI